MITPSGWDVAVVTIAATWAVAVSTFAILTVPNNDTGKFILGVAAAFIVMCAAMLVQDWLSNRRREDADTDTPPTLHRRGNS